MNDLLLTRYGIEPSIVISEDCFFTLSIENKAFLLTVLAELRLQAKEGKEGNLNLLLNGKILDFEKSVSAVFDFTDIDFNSKEITNLLLKNFSNFVGLGEQTEAVSNLESIILNLAEDFRVKSGLNVEYDTVINGINLAKICSLRIADHGGSLLKRLCEHVNLLCDLKPLKLFALVFGKQFLTTGDVQNLYAHCVDKGVRVLVIEGEDKSKLLSCERRLVIDDDLCSITQGHNEN